MPFRLSYYPQFSTTELLRSPTSLQDSLAREVSRSFTHLDTERKKAGHLFATHGADEELIVGEERIIRTPDTVIAYRPPPSQEGNPKPVAVLEVGFTQPYDSLCRLVDIWMEGKPTLRMVLLVKLKEYPHYARHPNVQYVRERGVDKFPAVDDIDTRDIEECSPGERGGPLSIYGLPKPVPGRVTGAMEVWVSDQKTGKPVKKGESIEFYGGKTTPPNLIFGLREFVPRADPDAEVVFNWEDIGLEIDGSRKDTAFKRYEEILSMVRTGAKVPRGRK